ncbi:matrixin family metalloprotease [Flectobacillus roseus]|uniref:Matrixin family metalloprotease n=1 Tax=Flectobacillus roseus TaxID=502259 RepID=A0ABT6Y2V1_9BACT|nr:matrixin family metalloprotease [Flectobacillus roseus]MDI9857899.1 matrixin family metalloprotease [Flectobacillus roseus]
MFKNLKIAFLLTVYASGLIYCIQKDHKTEAAITIAIQPFTGIPEKDVVYVEQKIKSFYPKVVVLPKINLPKQAYYKTRNRYRADSILVFLNQSKAHDFVFIGLTSKDISATKGINNDFGVLGLGYCPGKACVASTFRLEKNTRQEQLFKVAIHELGHTQGLPHCKQKHCFMRDAEGKNPTNEEKEFCKDCKKHLRGKGWKL